MPDSIASFVNGVLAGAGAVLALMSFGLLQLTKSIEGVMGFSNIEIRVGMLMGALVCAVAIGYEYYRKKDVKKQSQSQKDETEKDKTEKDKTENQQTQESVSSDE